MNILIPDSWLREYLETDASSSQIKECLTLCGPSIEKVTKVGNDYIYNIEITTNRVDMAGVYGIAREAAAILPRFGIKAKLKTPNINIPPSLKINLPLTVQDSRHLCDRLLAFAMDNVKIGPSPNFIKERLEKSGVRSLNNVIDITNYVMLELGHPCHVFDYDRIQTGKLILRRARKGETLITLDNKKCFLDENDVVIDDGTGRIIDLPGIMGTENSVVTTNTKKIVVFIESNNPVNIRKTSMKLALRTLAATINEKHPDPELSKTTILRAIDLYQNIVGAQPVGNLIDIYPQRPKPQTINVTIDFINQRLGISLSQQEIVGILKSLEFDIKVEGKRKLILTPPSFRQFDVTILEDIVEEVARIYGYHNLPSKLMTGEIPLTDKPKDLPVEEKIKQILKYWGYTETYHYSFVSEALIAKTGISKDDHLKIANPLTKDFVHMRNSLIPSLLETVTRNQPYNQNMRLFELAKIYLPKKDDLPEEISMLAIADQTGFYELKGVIEMLLTELGITNFFLLEKDHPFWHPKQSINYAKDDLILLTLGKLHPNLTCAFEIKKDLFIAEINIDRLVAFAKPIKKYTPIPSHPSVIEDLSFSYPSQTKLGMLISEIYTINPLINKVELIDRYKTTITLRLTYQHHKRNLTSQEIKEIREKILQNLKTKFKATLKQ